jgi:hypothetical protein
MPEFTGTVTQPGLYGDIPEAVYHADCVEGGSLSVSGAKLLLPPSVPAKYQYAREHGRESTPSQRLGTVAHALTLGTPVDDYAVLGFDTRTRSKAYMAAEKEVLDAGKKVLLRKEWDEAVAISDALLTHPTAGALLQGIRAEVSMFWRDPEFDIWLRGRMDAFRLDGETPTIVDLKTSKDASPDAFAKSVHEWGYHRQHPWYCEGLAAAVGCEPRDVDFIFAVVETEPPYLVATYRLSDGTDGPNDVALGREQNRIAREIWRDCTATGRWPGYSLEIEQLELRRYDRQQAERTVNEWYA